MNKEKLSELAELVDAVGLSRLDIRTDDFKIKIAKRKKQTVFKADKQDLIKRTKPISKALDDSSCVAIKAERVGSFYSTHASDMQDSLHVGDILQKDQPIGMIESMGIEYIIKSPEKCVLIETFANDTQPVEYGEILFKLKIVESDNA